MEEGNNFTQINKLIDGSDNILILMPDQAKKSLIISSLCLLSSLEQKGKKVSIYCNSDKIEKISFLENTHLIKSKLEPQNLIVSLDYAKEEIEKVSYESPNNKFNLVITPKKGRIDPSKVSFYSAERKSDLIIVLGSTSLSNLKSFYEEQKELFEKEKIVNIDNHEGNTLFGKVNLVDAKKATVSELLFELFDNTNVEWSPELSDLMLMSIYLGTDNFQSYRVGSGTFMLVSKLLERGAEIRNVIDKIYNRKKTVDNNNTTVEKNISSKQQEKTNNAANSPVPFLKESDAEKDVGMQIQEPQIFRESPNIPKNVSW